MTASITLRPLAAADNAVLARIVRDTLREFGSDKPGTAYFDHSTDHLFELFAAEPRSAYIVATQDDTLLGGAGVYPTAGLPPTICEMVKVYLLPTARGLGLGQRLVEQCFDMAHALGYEQIYLETTPEMKKALPLYEKLGFRYLPGPLGNSGHFGCDIWMLRDV
ncbi:GNAT family N-acetyltransferase [Hymenobacter terrenus]|uniref:GNAT family N-acetyltransferase n=1 Tax=Hymenobacter terrenus TaxID=1629124 RepID=UPI0006197B74|nr:GNAT family N-acetyltransferase [Hymenobacter terrenus]